MKASFSSWKTGAPYYAPLLVIGLAVLAWAIPAGQWYIGVIALTPGLFTLNFFRDPPRRITTDPQEIVSPADGLVVEVADVDDTPHYDGPCKRISIFLNIFNVHINRAPDDATITAIEYRPGLFKNAMTADSGEVNEANTLRLDTPHGPMTVRQISGLVARRIVCVPEVGETLQKGEKFGMIKFGSRTEIYMPPGAVPGVSLRQKVHGGSTVIARMP